MKIIPLTKGKYTVVDDWNFEWLNQWKWHTHYTHGIWYAARNIKHNGKWTTERMHRVILGLKPGDKRQSDHINHNELDNRECNLRIVTVQQNHFNQRNPKGYYWHKYSGKWRAKIGFNGKEISLGYFDYEEDAHKAYLSAKEKYHIIGVNDDNY